LQQRIDGEPCSAVFLATNGEATLLGVTQQLIGTRWLNADGFQYAGSIGPIFPMGDVLTRWRELGAALAATFQLRGLFGVDVVMRHGIPWPVEINPRYTASVEVIERCWRGAAIEPPDGKPPLARNIERLVSDTGILWGKAIVFARQTFFFPGNGPWLDALKDSADLDETEYADIPHAGEMIEQGKPVLTIFASGKSIEDCRRGLQEKAQDLDRRWWG
jgi:predicted ATP-grasp superfamily ATP-dependent carboligase